MPHIDLKLFKLLRQAQREPTSQVDTRVLQANTAPLSSSEILDRILLGDPVIAPTATPDSRDLTPRQTASVVSDFGEALVHEGEQAGEALVHEGEKAGAVLKPPDISLPGSPIEGILGATQASFADGLILPPLPLPPTAPIRRPRQRGGRGGGLGLIIAGDALGISPVNLQAPELTGV